MMTFAVNHFAELGFHYMYLGSCYLENALYKTQFAVPSFLMVSGGPTTSKSSNI
jgi:hypothetical protein